MKKAIWKLFLLALFAGGWTLSAASLYVIRLEGKTWWQPKFVLVTKNKLTFRDTWVDATKWTREDLSEHPQVNARLEQLGRLDVLQPIRTAVRPVPATQPVVAKPALPVPPVVGAGADGTVAPPNPTPSAPPIKHEKSIFDDMMPGAKPGAP